MDQGPKDKKKKTVMSLKENTEDMCLDIGVGFWGMCSPKYTQYICIYLYVCQNIYV